jgi:hypothetical protein
MLGSAHDGEVVAAAARRADELMKDAGLTWPEALRDTQADLAERAARMLLPENEELRAALDCVHARPSLPRWQEPRTAEKAFDLCLLWRDRLTEWEAGFVSSIARRTRISEKQRAMLIAAKIRRLARADA